MERIHCTLLIGVIPCVKCVACHKLSNWNIIACRRQIRQHHSTIFFQFMLCVKLYYLRHKAFKINKITHYVIHLFVPYHQMQSIETNCIMIYIIIHVCMYTVTLWLSIYILYCANRFSFLCIINLYFDLPVFGHVLVVKQRFQLN